MNIKITVLLLISSLSTFANNIVVSNVSVASQNTSLKYKMIKMDVTWQNSWRTYNNESNYDAAWIFIKYRKQAEAIWNHATLNFVNGSSDGHVKPANGDVYTPADGKGIFVFRANSSPTNFIGTATYTNMELRWNYGANGLVDSDLVEIAVFAIEMVYVPQSAFYAGDGLTAGIGSSVRFQNGATSSPFNITSENQLTLGGSSAGNLSTPQTTTGVGKDDFSQTVTQVLPAAFPKGFKAFYCMKYEISQDQYAEFLKKLTAAQTANRYQNAFGTHRFTIDASYTAQAPNRACFMRWHDGIAYADWSGLRPMTELEYEKACRGPVIPVPGEYAWGNTTLRPLKTIAADGTPSETDGDSPRANVHYNQGMSWDLTNPLFGPMRCGWSSGGTRENGGDTYFGISDMSGNLEEATVSVGIASSRVFTGTNGDGNLTSAGHANNTDWPGYDAATSETSGNVYVRFKGGSVFGVVGDLTRFETLQISRRASTNTLIYFWDSGTNAPRKREPYLGFRAVRSIN